MKRHLEHYRGGRRQGYLLSPSLRRQGNLLALSLRRGRNLLAPSEEKWLSPSPFTGRDKCNTVATQHCCSAPPVTEWTGHTAPRQHLPLTGDIMNPRPVTSWAPDREHHDPLIERHHDPWSVTSWPLIGDIMTPDRVTSWPLIEWHHDPWLSDIMSHWPFDILSYLAGHLQPAQFCMDLHTNAISSGMQTSKTEQSSEVLPAAGDLWMAVRRTWSAHAAVDTDNTTCTISTLAPLTLVTTPWVLRGVAKQALSPMGLETGREQAGHHQFCIDLHNSSILVVQLCRTSRELRDIWAQLGGFVFPNEERDHSPYARRGT